MKSLRARILAMASVVAVSGLMMASVAGAGTPKLMVQDSTLTTKFVVNDDGSTGIGVQAPGYPLHISSDIAGGVAPGVGMVQLQGNGNKERFELRSFGIVNGQGPAIQGKGAGGTVAAPTHTLTNHVLLSIGGSGYEADGTAGLVIGNSGLFQFRAEENWTTAGHGTFFVVQTTPSGSLVRTEQLRVTGNGNVGIGTTAPTNKLHIAGDTIRLDTPRTPASSTAACNVGEISWDVNYVYVCVATNSWKRTALGTW